MRVLLRNAKTGLFYAGPEKWTPDYADAHDFGLTDAALDCVSASRLQQMELLMRFDESGFDIPLTIVGTGG